MVDCADADIHICFTIETELMLQSVNLMMTLGFEVKLFSLAWKEPSACELKCINIVGLDEVE
jgi:hypothetical protein